MNQQKTVAVSFLVLILLILNTSEIHSGVPGIIRSLLEIFSFLVIPSIGFTIIYQKLRKNPFTAAEFLSLSAANFFLLIPAIVLFSLYILSYRYVSAPLIILSLLSCLVIYGTKLHPIVFEKNDHVLFFAIVILGIFIWIITHAYYPLPDFDPYYWLSRFQATLNAYYSGSLLVGNRPGFFAMFFTYSVIAHIDAYALFKYFLPMLYVLPLFPLWMIAKKIKLPWGSYAMLSTIVWSASTILYALTSMPQMICISAFFFFISFLVYARITKDAFYIGVALAILALASLTYELVTVPFLVIVAVLIWKQKRNAISYIKNNPVVALLCGLLLLTNLHYISNEIYFLIFWIVRIGSQLVSINLNLLFPEYYINIDGNSVGWQGPWGVTRYYLYYVGPPTILVIVITLYTLSLKKYRHMIWGEIKNHIETQIALATFIIFFSISEIFPRIFNLALLPERTWIFGGIMIVYPAFFILYYSSFKTSRKIAGFLLIASLASVYGAWFINHQKQHLIPTYQLSSASWVQENLPLDRIMISDENSNLLAFFSSSRTATLSPLYCNEQYSNSRVLLNNIQHTNLIQNVYIFYAETDPSNPYTMRPYAKARESCSAFVFDKYPQNYERVYSDGSRVIIWKIK